MSDQDSRVGDRYELGELLGRGGMAEVRKAMDTRLNRPVAVKQLRTDLATDPTFQARFRREAQAAAGLNHPTIVAVYDTGEETHPLTGVRVPYIVMELVEGITLRDVLRDGRKILPERALELSTGVLDALSYSHKAGIVHRDIKPANVMLTPGGDVKVMDFGIARAVADTSSTMTQTAAVIGTAQYLSPEQARGETVDARSDIYSAGCLLYELLVGRPPFTGDSPVSVAYQHVREEPKPPSSIDPEITADMDRVVMRSLAKDPADRYQSARQMKDDIVRLLGGQSPVAAAFPASGPTPGEQPTALLVPDRVPEPPGYVTAPTMAVGAGAVAGVAAGAALADQQPPHHPARALADEPRRKGPLVALILLIVLALAAVVAAVAFLGPGAPQAQPSPSASAPPPSSSAPPPSPSAQPVTVPNVIGQTREQATNTLSGLGLTVEEVEEQGADDSSVNQVIQQNPPGQQQVAPGSRVTITINVGPDQAAVPEVQGLPAAEAEARLREAGFTTITRQAAETEEPGTEKDTVLAVSPAQNSQAAPDAQITLTVATGQGEVPNFVGGNRERAEADAEAAGFEVEFEGDDDSGTVVSQNPGRGNRADWGSTITLTMSGTPGGGETSESEGEGEGESEGGTPSGESSAPNDPGTGGPGRGPAATPTPGRGPR